MRNISCIIGLCVFCSTIATGGSAFLDAATAPAYNQHLSRVRFLPEEPMVKVLLAKDQEGFMVDVKGSHNIYDPYSGKKLDADFTGSSYYMTPTTDGVKWGQEFPGVFQITIVTDEPSAGVFINGIAYPGAVTFYEIGNRLTAVNWISLDDFTSSIFSTNFLPKETDQREALAAYGIAIRTKAYEQLNTGHSPYWDVSAEGCGYRGNAVVRFDEPFREAMKATKRIVMVGNGTTPASGTGFDKKTIEDIYQRMPIADAQSMAKDGKDARIILHKFFPDQNLMMVEAKPVFRETTP